MTTKNPSNPDSSAMRGRVVPYAIATITILIGGLYLRSIQSSTNTRMDQLAEQNVQLQKALTDAKKTIDQLNSGDSSMATTERLEKTRASRTPEPVEKEIETLFLQNPVVEQISDGLLVRLEYKPEAGTALPDTTTIVFRVPDTDTARILSLTAAGSPSNAIMNPKRTLAMIECSPSETGSLGFELKVSEPITATVRGSEGIIDFKIDITPDGCTIRKL